MAFSILAVHSCGMCFSEKCLRRATVLEAGRGYRNVMGGTMRLNQFLFSQIKICFRSKHKFVDKLLNEADGHHMPRRLDGLNLLKKVSVWMGDDGVHDLADSERIQKDSGIMDDVDVSLACKQFPSIILGRSPMVELYDGNTNSGEKSSLVAAQICKGLLTTYASAKWDDPDIASETWPIGLCSSLSNSLVLNEKNSHAWSVSAHSSAQLSEVKLNLHETGRKLNNQDGIEVQDDNTLVELKAEEAISCLPGQSTRQCHQLEECGDTLVQLKLDEAISRVPGLSKRQCRQLEDCGIHTLRKLLHHFPRTYADLQNAQIGIDDGQYLIFVGRILSSRGIRASQSFSFLEVVVGCEVAEGESISERSSDDFDSRSKRTIYLHLKKFFRGTRFTYQPFLKSVQEKHKEGDTVCVSGKVRAMRTKHHYEMKEYNLDVLEEEQDSSLCAEGRPYPIYPSKGGLKPQFLGDIISRALKTLPVNIDPVPEAVTQDFGLVSLYDAYIGIHQPKDFHNADLARKRLIFDEFFYLQLGRLFQMLEGLGTQIEKDGLLNKYMKPELNAVFIEDWSELTKKFLKALPYSLTASQLTAVSEIIWDLKRQVPMNRLLQGDVGCGKTVVAFLACMEVIGSGYQAAFMVPTELLAVQHYEQLLSLLQSMEEDQHKPHVALLTGSTPAKQSRLIREGLQTGEISLIIGTHSLIAENVEFSALRIAIVDEQHRFGVIQRGRFNSKLLCNPLSSRLAGATFGGPSNGDVCMAPHVLALSATPIPRTLALALYGDMSLTQITDLPPGRIPVETFIVEGNEIGFEKVYQMMLDELEAGGKIYLVYPIIEQSEQLPQLRAASTDFEIISSRFESYSCGLLHGRMKSDEKDEALRRFRSGETNMLLSTQVIEIGVDVPDASMMVVLNAERFGIAQLHQLRGRVGRGERKSKCILVASTESSLNRLRVLEKSSDGFYLANMDLVLRGPGDLLGKKQSGHLPEFPIARLEMDGNILQDAHLAALKVLGMSHDLKKFPDLKAELSMRQPLSFLGD